jgi:ABC-type amino acid transport substrate-binding protein
MKKAVLTLTVLSLLAFLGGASAFAQASAEAPQGQAATKTTAHHAKHHAAHHQMAANPTARYQRGVHTVSGTLTAVDTNGKLLIVTDSDGVPFNFVVTPRTRIEVNGKKGNFDGLAGNSNQQVTVKFMDHLKGGLMAQSVQVGS